MSVEVIKIHPIIKIGYQKVMNHLFRGVIYDVESIDGEIVKLKGIKESFELKYFKEYKKIKK